MLATEQCKQDLNNFSIEEQSTHSIKTKCGNKIVIGKEFIFLAKSQLYLVIAHGSSSRDGAICTTSVIAYDKAKKLIRDVSIDSATIGTSSTSFGGLVKIKNEIKDEAVLLPEETVYIKYKIQLNKDNNTNDGFLSNIRIIPITSDELDGLRERPEEESLANFWDRRAGFDASGAQTRIYHYCSDATNLNLSRDKISVICEPRPAIAVHTKYTDVAV